MRILHTADWHLCDRLNKLDRTADLRTRVEQVAAYCEHHHVELLLIAGDLFYERASDEEIADSLRHVHATFQPFFARGGTILAITGNHDDDGQLELVRSGLALAAAVPSGGVFQRGRLYLQNGLTFGTFAAAGGERLQVVMVPYPRPARYDLPDSYRTREEEFRLLQHTLASWVADLREKSSFDKTLPTVLMAHLHVRGANLNTSLFRFSNPADIQIEPADLKAGWAYVALGHIHLPQAIDGAETIRYPGPLDRLDFGEMTDQRGVLLVDVGPAGVTAQPEWLTLEPTPMHHVAIADPDAELPTLADKFPDRQTAIVRLEVTQAPGTKLSRNEIARQLNAIFARVHRIDWLGDDPHEAAADSAPGLALNGAKPFTQTIREYLAAELADDPDRADVLALAETFLAAETEGAAT